LIAWGGKSNTSLAARERKDCYVMRQAEDLFHLLLCASFRARTNWALFVLSHVSERSFLASVMQTVWLKGPVRERGESEMLKRRF
jgi:hypothetical protein